MAGSISRERGEPFAMQSLWRLATWGAGATLALALAAAAAYSETGSRRLVYAFDSSIPLKVDRTSKSAASRAADANAALAETVRLLAAERDRLAARMSKLEKHLDDLTGSITASQRPEASGTTLPAEPGQAIPAPASEALRAADANESSKGEYGADIGSAASFDGLRALWSSAKANNPDEFQNLYPVVSVQENGRTRAPQLRLIVGPFLDWEGANHFCAAVASPRLLCQPTAFDGQRLADADRPAERKPATPRGTTRPSSSPPSRLFGLF
jgi:hypothetical protein